MGKTAGLEAKTAVTRSKLPQARASSVLARSFTVLHVHLFYIEFRHLLRLGQDHRRLLPLLASGVELLFQPL